MGQVKFDIEETSWFYDIYYPRFKARYEFEAFERISDSALALVESTTPQSGGTAEIDRDKFLDEVAFNKEVNAMLYLLYVNYTTRKYQLRTKAFEQTEEEEDILIDGIDDPQRIIIQDKGDIIRDKFHG